MGRSLRGPLQRQLRASAAGGFGPRDSLNRKHSPPFFGFGLRAPGVKGPARRPGGSTNRKSKAFFCQVQPFRPIRLKPAGPKTSFASCGPPRPEASARATLKGRESLGNS